MARRRDRDLGAPARTIALPELDARHLNYSLGDYRIEVTEGRTGLLYATSPDLRGLLVAARTRAELVEMVPDAIRDLLAVAWKRFH